MQKPQLLSDQELKLIYVVRPYSVTLRNAFGNLTRELLLQCEFNEALLKKYPEFVLEDEDDENGGFYRCMVDGVRVTMEARKREE